MTRRSILVVDDEPQIHRFLKPALESADYIVERADTAAQALHLAKTKSPDLILLDLGLPDFDGQVALVRLRATTKVPILIVSARGHEREKVQALDAGADDFIEKPFAVNELLARLRVCLRHAARLDDGMTRWRHLSVEVDIARRVVSVAGDYVALSAREYDLLSLLISNVGRVVTHRQLLIGVWGPAHSHDVQYLRVYIGHLRQKLGQDFAACLLTEAGVGYRIAEGN